MDWSATRSAWLKACLGIGISSWAIYLCIVSFDWADVWLQIKHVPIGVIFMSVVCYLAGFIFRAWRASLMMETLCRPSMFSSLVIVTIGYAGNNLLPFRMGELMRADAAARIYGIRRGSAIVQVGSERIMDAMAIVALLLTSMLMVRISGTASEQIHQLAKLAAVGFGMGVICLVLVIRFGEIIKARIQGRGRIVQWVVSSVIDTLSGLRNSSRLTLVMFASLMVWLLEAGSFSILASHWGMEHVVPIGWFVMGVVNLSVLLPSAPGHVGIYHWAVVLALGGLAVSGSAAMSFAVVIHAIQWVSITTIGLMFMLFFVRGGTRLIES